MHHARGSDSERRRPSTAESKHAGRRTQGPSTAKKGKTACLEGSGERELVLLLRRLHEVELLLALLDHVGDVHLERVHELAVLLCFADYSKGTMSQVKATRGQDDARRETKQRTSRQDNHDDGRAGKDAKEQRQQTDKKGNKGMERHLEDAQEEVDLARHVLVAALVQVHQPRQRRAEVPHKHLRSRHE